MSADDEGPTLYPSVPHVRVVVTTPDGEKVGEFDVVWNHRVIADKRTYPAMADDIERAIEDHASLIVRKD